MNTLTWRVRQMIVRYLDRKYRAVITITVDLNRHEDWDECRTFIWGKGLLDDAFKQYIYTTEVGKWLLEHPWHTIAGVGNISIDDSRNQVQFSALQFKFLKKSDAALFKLRFPV